jgi:hypothetical protein
MTGTFPSGEVWIRWQNNAQRICVLDADGAPCEANMRAFFCLENGTLQVLHPEEPHLTCQILGGQTKRVRWLRWFGGRLQVESPKLWDGRRSFGVKLVWCPRAACETETHHVHQTESLGARPTASLFVTICSERFSYDMDDDCWLRRAPTFADELAPLALGSSFAQADELALRRLNGQLEAALLAIRERNPCVSLRGAQYEICKDTLYRLGGKSVDVEGGIRTEQTVSAFRAVDLPTGKRLAVSMKATARSLHCMCVVGNMLYVLGGRFNRYFPLRDLERYDPALGKWTTLRHTLWQHLDSAAVEFAGRLFVFGQDGCETYDPATNVWTKLPTMPTPRRRVAVAVWDRAVYLVGGIDPDQHSSLACERFDFITHEWTRLASLPCGPFVSTLYVQRSW